VGNLVRQGIFGKWLKGAEVPFYIAIIFKNFGDLLYVLEN
jgi:hypothetical protein